MESLPGKIINAKGDVILLGKYTLGEKDGCFFPDEMPEPAIFEKIASLLPVETGKSLPISYLRACMGMPDRHYHFELGADAPQPPPQVVTWSIPTKSSCGN